MAALVFKKKLNRDLLCISRLERTKRSLTMSPFMLYLYLKPLYSNLGGSTTRADPFTIKPGFELLRLEPLYN